MESTPRLAVGLMSGTSADGIDAAFVRTDGEQDYQFVDFAHFPYEPKFQSRLIRCAAVRAAQTPPTLADSKVDTEQLEYRLTELHSQAIESLLARTQDAKPDLIGFHGHTILHAPANRFTHQIGNAQLLADATEVPVVHDFRSDDIEAGGQGAPLVPLFHQMLFADSLQPCAVVNIGGVANVTWLDHGKIIAGDTGPGCGMLDSWMQSNLGMSFDRDGAVAQQGIVHQEIVQRTKEHGYFQKKMPKSADRFDFCKLASLDGLNAADGAATLCELTAMTIADAIQAIGTPRVTWVSGGGSRNPQIMRRLVERLGKVKPIEDYGLRSDSLEAECFAWLAVRRLRNLPTSVPSTTGCSRPTSGGAISRPASFGM